MLTEKIDGTSFRLSAVANPLCFYSIDTSASAKLRLNLRSFCSNDFWLLAGLALVTTVSTYLWSAGNFPQLLEYVSCTGRQSIAVDVTLI